jgi:lipoprotein-anchoring transpeptidase ErfK/SrfK
VAAAGLFAGCVTVALVTDRASRSGQGGDGRSSRIRAAREPDPRLDPHRHDRSASNRKGQETPLHGPTIRRIVVAAVGSLLAGCITAALVIEWAGRPGEGGSQSARTAAAARPSLPPSPAPAFVVPTPKPLRGSPWSAQSATVMRSTVAYARPNVRSRVVASLDRRTPEGTSNLVLVVGRASDRRGALWVRVRLPVLPNNSTGWVRRDALGVYRVVRTRLRVELNRLTATLFDDGRVVFRAPIGVGKPQWPTPRGRFYVRIRLTGYRSSLYGPVAFGTSARSSTLTEWPGGGFIGIHGTSRPDLLPGRVSHGCIRMRNADIVRLGRLMPVGTPVTIE